MRCFRANEAPREILPKSNSRPLRASETSYETHREYRKNRDPAIGTEHCQLNCELSTVNFQLLAMSRTASSDEVHSDLSAAGEIVFAPVTEGRRELWTAKLR